MNERHISDDPELAAAYVLGRVSPEEQDRMNTHLRDCPACRSYIDTELRTAAASRRLGRDELRARLRSRLVRPRRTVRILAVAATIASLVGIGILTRFFVIHQEQPEVSSGLTDRAAPQQEQHALRTVPPAETAATETKPKAESRDVPRTPTRREDEALSVATGAPAAAAPAPGVARAKSAADAYVIGEIVAGETYWTEGVPSVAPRTEERLLSAAADKKDAAGKGSAEASATQQFVLVQRPVAELPVSQQNRQIYRNSIPTLIQQQGTQTLMTLYLDSLVDQNELARARVEQRGTDSLVIRMRNQSIQYLLPANRSRQQVR